MQARTPKIARFSNGNVPYELQVQTNTIITDLGPYDLLILPDTEPEYIAFYDVMNTSARVGK